MFDPTCEVPGNGNKLKTNASSVNKCFALVWHLGITKDSTCEVTEDNFMFDPTCEVPPAKWHG